MDLVRRTLEEARGAARSQGKDVGRGGRGSQAAQGRGQQSAALVGAGPGFARPADCSASVTRDLARSRGWSDRVAEGAVFGRWPAVVGEQIAAHATPTALNDGVLTVSAESTAWATQLRMVQAQLIAKIAAAVGDGVVKSLKIVGPVGAVVAQRPLPHRRPRARATRTDEHRFRRWLRAARTPQVPFSSVLTHLGSKNSADGANRCVETPPQNRS